MLTPKHLVVALVNDGSGFRLFLDTQDGDTPELAAARFLACQDLRRVAVYELAILDGVGAIEIHPIKPFRTTPVTGLRVQ